MPIKQNAMKALRQAKKHTTLNTHHKKLLRSALKEARELLSAKQVDKAAEGVKKAVKALDKSVGYGILKANTSSRTKSRLMRALAKLGKK